MVIITPQDVNSIDDLSIENRVLEPFCSISLDFVNDISKSILKNIFFKQYPELMALAFWMRKSHIKELKNYFFEQKKDKILFGRGIVFHIAPSNVDTIFVYSWFLSLLVGNSNILRVSDRNNIQTELLLEVITKILHNKKYAILQNRVAIIRYGHVDDITEKLSNMADVRVIWGGDNTIKQIRNIPIKPTAIELTFADKFSFAIIKSKKLIEDEKLELLIEKFYNDAFWFGQMACSSIRLIVWVGDKSNNQKAKEIFWNRLNSYLLEKQPKEIFSSDVINKFVAQCSMAIEKNIIIKSNNNPYINRVKIENLKDISTKLHCGAGLFYELEQDKFESIFPHITKKYQTIAQYGFSKDELKVMINSSMPEGIDRVVPIGKSLDFSYIWDGYDLFRSFCREIEIL